MTSASHKKSINYADKTMQWVLILFMITFVHHIYGGYIYESMERFIIGIVFASALIGTIILYTLRATKKWARYGFWMIVFFGWVGIIGLIEGGFNHVVKVGLFVNGIDPSFLYSPDEYEPPTDLFFEITGILTLVPALMIIALFIKKLLKR